MRRIDRLRQLAQAKRRTAVTITEFPTWCIPADLLARVKDGTCAPVKLDYGAGFAGTVWAARSGDQFVACAPVGQASPEDIAAWCAQRFVELAKPSKQPPAPKHDFVTDIWKP